jgi:hypothetical protein
MLKRNHSATESSDVLTDLAELFRTITYCKLLVRNYEKEKEQLTIIGRRLHFIILNDEATHKGP